MERDETPIPGGSKKESCDVCPDTLRIVPNRNWIQQHADEEGLYLPAGKQEMRK